MQQRYDSDLLNAGGGAELPLCKSVSATMDTKDLEVRTTL